MILQRVPPLDKPIPHLEQYLTPASIAADIIFTAHQFGDVENKAVLDLGCGTGIFSVGAILTGAKKVVGIDVDKNSIEIARDYAEKNDFEIKFLVQDVKDVEVNCDTVIMNPPFTKKQRVSKLLDKTELKKQFDRIFS